MPSPLLDHPEFECAICGGSSNNPVCSCCVETLARKLECNPSAAYATARKALGLPIVAQHVLYLLTMEEALDPSWEPLIAYAAAHTGDRQTFPD